MNNNDILKLNKEVLENLENYPLTESVLDAQEDNWLFSDWLMTITDLEESELMDTLMVSYEDFASNEDAIFTAIACEKWISGRDYIKVKKLHKNLESLYALLLAIYSDKKTEKKGVRLYQFDNAYAFDIDFTRVKVRIRKEVATIIDKHPEILNI